MKKLSNMKNREEGQTLVEFALILPLLLLLIVAIIDFGWIFMAKITVNNAAREAARQYAVNNDSTAAQQAAIDAMDFVTLEGRLITVTQIKLSNTPPNYQAKVKIDGSVRPLVGLFFTGPIPVNTESYMRIEYDVP